MPSNNSNYKYCLLESMNYFHKFCEENNLVYSIIGGTLLGAVRHKGYIPWDDDIDVVMPRDDYDRLITLTSQLKHPFQLNSHITQDGYIYPYLKLSNSDFVVEEILYKPFRCGVWIDIFPLDYTFNNLKSQKLHFSLVSIIRKLWILKHGAFKTTKRSRMTICLLIMMHYITKIIPKKALSYTFKLLELAPTTIFKRHLVLANLYGAWGYKETAPKEIFKDRVLYDFEGYQFWGIKNYDFWLKKVYGDYMELPPKSKRVSNHNSIVVSQKNG